MAENDSVVEVKIAWWFTGIYMPILIALTRFLQDYVDMEIEPSEESIEKVLALATSARIVNQ